MKIFISWSGQTSKELGNALYEWLPLVLQVTKPFFTPCDVDAGLRWSDEIAAELEQSQFGIFCMTRDNLESPWIMFEAGAISKKPDSAKVCPLLLDIDPGELRGPLSQFQATRFNEKEVEKLLASINESCVDGRIKDSALKKSFEIWWPELEAKVKQIGSSETTKTQSALPSDRDLLLEILTLSRVSARAEQSKSRSYRADVTAIRDTLIRFHELAGAINCGADRERLEFLLKSLLEPIESLCRIHPWESSSRGSLFSDLLKSVKEQLPNAFPVIARQLRFEKLLDERQINFFDVDGKSEE